VTVEAKKSKLARSREEKRKKEDGEWFGSVFLFLLFVRGCELFEE
jgi:hypothetical protein